MAQNETPLDDPTNTDNVLFFGALWAHVDLRVSFHSEKTTTIVAKHRSAKQIIFRERGSGSSVEPARGEWRELVVRMAVSRKDLMLRRLTPDPVNPEKNFLTAADMMLSLSENPGVVPLTHIPGGTQFQRRMDADVYEFRVSFDLDLAVLPRISVAKRASLAVPDWAANLNWSDPHSDTFTKQIPKNLTYEEFRGVQKGPGGVVAVPKKSGFAIDKTRGPADMPLTEIERRLTAEIDQLEQAGASKKVTDELERRLVEGMQRQREDLARMIFSA